MRAVADTSGVMQARRPHDSVESLMVVVVAVNNGHAGSSLDHDVGYLAKSRQNQEFRKGISKRVVRG